MSDNEDTFCEDIIAKIQKLPQNTEFEPLDDVIREDAAFLQSTEMRQLLARCVGGVLRLGTEWDEASSEWRTSLNEYRMARYCGVLSNLFEGTLLKSGRPLESAVGHIHGVMENPIFEIVPNASSELAAESGISGAAIVYSTEDIARHIALRVHEPNEHAELAWRSIAWCLPECTASPFPRLAIRKRLEGQIELRLLPS